jgi:hypothetical protein
MPHTCLASRSLCFLSHTQNKATVVAMVGGSCRSCPRCTLDNVATASQCAVCGTPLTDPVPKGQHSAVPSVGRPVTPPSPARQHGDAGSVGRSVTPPSPARQHGDAGSVGRSVTPPSPATAAHTAMAGRGRGRGRGTPSMMRPVAAAAAKSAFSPTGAGAAAGVGATSDSPVLDTPQRILTAFNASRAGRGRATAMAKRANSPLTVGPTTGLPILPHPALPLTPLTIGGTQRTSSQTVPVAHPPRATSPTAHTASSFGSGGSSSSSSVSLGGSIGAPPPELASSSSMAGSSFRQPVAVAAAAPVQLPQVLPQHFGGGAAPEAIYVDPTTGAMYLPHASMSHEQMYSPQYAIPGVEYVMNQDGEAYMVAPAG